MARLQGVVIGAGDRGLGAYAPYLRKHRDEGRITAVAEPLATRRQAFAKRYDIPADRQFESYEALLAGRRLGDFALIATGDALHVEPAVLAMQQGYHVLLEKPMALCEADCRRLVEVSEKTGRILQVCHVIRYAPLFVALERTIRSGELGDVVAIQHSENVSYWHYAHSYCRGNWRNVAESSPMILAKSCHDMDLLYWLAGAEPDRLSSLARPTELCAENVPDGAPLHCIDGCAHAQSCPYDAVAMYREMLPMLRDLEKTARPMLLGELFRLVRRWRPLLEKMPFEALRKSAHWTGWPVSVISDDVSPAGIDRALRSTRYGRCVYRVGDNDQVSSQTVSVLFSNGVNASFSMHSTSHREGREIRVDGTRGSAVGRFYLLEQRLDVSDHKTGAVRTVKYPLSFAPHGGGDFRLFAGFLAAVRGEAEPVTSARESLQSHLMAFAADRAQREGVVMEFAGGIARPVPPLST